MAAVLVGGALLSATLQVVFDRLASREVLDYLRGNKLSNELIDNLKVALLAVNAVLDDAEEKQITNPNIKQWLDELEAASYDADDLLDEIATHALQSKLEKASGSRKSRRSKFFNSFSISRRSYNRDMKNKLEEILRRFEVFEKSINFLGLTNTNKGVGEKPSPRPPTTSLVEESEIYGRDGDKEAIIKLLLQDVHEGSNKVCVIPIVGLGGIGKTTLAQSVYNDHAVGKHFNLKSWVCVSEEFDICKVTKTVLCAVTNSLSHSYDNKDLDSLQTMLKEKLVEKKFLIVLDDVWNENYVNWENLNKPFKHGAQGSKILVTTRNKNVARIMHTVPPHHLEELKEEECWQLFAKHAFGNKDCNAYPVLVTIGRKVVKKCKGLPLAAKTLGGLLRSIVDVAKWERILESEIWDLPYDKSNILPALMLSYHYLPSPVKRCFAFCSVFPKDYQFRSHQLVSLWMADNLLPQATRNKRVEDVSDEYFNELVSMSFFQRSSQGEEESCFVMHDLVHDVAKFVSRGYCFTFENDNSNEDVMKVRHLAVARDVSFQRVRSISKAIPLRSLLVLDSCWSVSNEVVNNVILKLRCLRILSLSGCKYVLQLSESIGELKHLRFLDLSETSIKRLPNSVSKLYNLQTLNLLYCENLIELPEDMYHLINLRHLDISGCYNLKEMPRQIGDLKSLQRLSTFIVGEDNGTKIEALRELSELHGELSLKNLQNVASALDASEARLKDKKHLEGLHLFWYGYAEARIQDIEVAEKLLPHTNLKRLSIHGYGGTSFPNWLGDNSFCNIVSIKLESCKYCNSLPPLGQLPSLKTLHIEGLRGVVTVDAEFYRIIGGSSIRKPFASLEFLSFSNMSAWEEWSSIGVEDGEVFPMLQELCIFNCDRLGTVDWPDILPSLTKLQIEGSEVLVLSLPRTPALRELKLGVCEKLRLEELPQTVESIHMEGNNGVESLMEAIRKGQTPFLKELHIRRCCSAITFPVRCLPTSLTELDIYDCERLEFPIMHQHSSIQRVTIRKSCCSLVFYPLDLFPNLSSLSLSECENLESVGVSLDGDGLLESHSLTSLSYISISDCPNFISFLEGGLHAPNLTDLTVSGCKKFKMLPEQMHNHLPSLKSLSIYNCPELESFPESGLHSNLSRLMVKGCKKLKALPEQMRHLLPSLQMLDIIDCPELESFPEGGLPSNLSKLKVQGCKKLKALPEQMQNHLLSLKSLDISNCPEVESFADGGLPSNLTHLSVYHCPKLIAQRMKWKLHTLQALEHFEIGDECGRGGVESFPEEGLLPSTLSSLFIGRFPHLKRLDMKGLQQITSLKDLFIFACPQLQKLPQQGLPTSLEYLEIVGCPVLEERCQRETGQDWNIISHIPTIRIHHQCI